MIVLRVVIDSVSDNVDTFGVFRLWKVVLVCKLSSKGVVWWVVVVKMSKWKVQEHNTHSFFEKESSFVVRSKCLLRAQQ